MKQIILASSSPRRSELLKQLGLSFRTMTCEVDESAPGEYMPFQTVELLAVRKAMAAARMLEDGLVIGADTVVVLDGRVLGKPADPEDAVEMLSRLQGSCHEVYTGVALIDAGIGKVLVDHERTLVHFRNISEREIRSYVATGEPLDKAGAYGIQGLAAIFIKSLEGCYTNVVGLPLARLAEMLEQFNCRIL